MYVRFLRQQWGYLPGQIVLAGRGQPLGGGVVDVLLQRRIVEVVPDPEPKPRPARKLQRA